MSAIVLTQWEAQLCHKKEVKCNLQWKKEERSKNKHKPPFEILLALEVMLWCSRIRWNRRREEIRRIDTPSGSRGWPLLFLLRRDRLSASPNNTPSGGVLQCNRFATRSPLRMVKHILHDGVSIMLKSTSLMLRAGQPCVWDQLNHTPQRRSCAGSTE